MNHTESATDKLALKLCLAGVVLAVATTFFGNLLQQNFTMYAYLIFLVFQIAALVLGILSRASKLGTTAIITSSLLILGSFLFLS